eukprot:14191141-Alexandrium_andersonii.AAC.1
MSLGGCIYHLTRPASLDSILHLGLRSAADSEDWNSCTRMSRKFIHFLPFHPSDSRLAATSRLD